jgi:outer membrane biosynthesis protein TonB
MFTLHRISAHGRFQRPPQPLKRASVLAAAMLALMLAGPAVAVPASAATAAPTPSATATASATPSATPSETSAPAPAPAPAPIEAPPESAAPTPSNAPTPSETPSSSPTPTPDPAPTATATPTPTPTDPEAEPTPTPPAEPAPAAPTITGPAAGSFIGGSTTVSGGRDPSHEIQLIASIGGDPLCTVPVDGTGSWSCGGVVLPSGPDVQLQAVVSGLGTLSAPHTVRVLQAPTVTGGAIGQSTSGGLVRGTGYPGATVTATLATGQGCSFTVDSSGAWACLLEGELRSGQEQVTASQQTDFSAPASSPASAPVSLLIDVDAPSAPVLAAPTAGSELSLTGSQYYGEGENGATVTVFAGAYSVCSSVVSGGTWSCSGSGVAAGNYALRAVQQDAAGNVSAGSEPTPVRYGPAPATPTPSPTPTRSPKPTPTATPTPTPTPTATAPVRPGTTAAPTPSPSAAPVVPVPAGPDDDAAPELIVPGGWNDPTPFSTAVIPPWNNPEFPWLQSALLTLGALILLIIPARLLAGTISRARGGKPLVSGHRFAGRNHPHEDFEVPPTVHLARPVVAAAALLAGAVFVLLSGPVTGTPNYLRLFLAVVLALAVVNAVGILIPRWWGSRAQHLDVSASVLPRYLVVVALTALASRALELEPALIFGLLGSIVVRTGPLAAERGQLAAVRAGSLLLLGLGGLAVSGALSASGGAVAALTTEFVNTVVLASVGSAVLVLIPIGNTSGRSVLAWSPPVWAALAVPAYLTLFVLLSPTIAGWSGTGTVTTLWVAAAVFAGLSVALWAWQRYVVPAIR